MRGGVRWLEGVACRGLLVGAQGAPLCAPTAASAATEAVEKRPAQSRAPFRAALKNADGPQSTSHSHSTSRSSTGSEKSVPTLSQRLAPHTYHFSQFRGRSKGRTSPRPSSRDIMPAHHHHANPPQHNTEQQSCSGLLVVRPDGKTSGACGGGDIEREGSGRRCRRRRRVRHRDTRAPTMRARVRRRLAIRPHYMHRRTDRTYVSMTCS